MNLSKEELKEICEVFFENDMIAMIYNLNKSLDKAVKERNIALELRLKKDITTAKSLLPVDIYKIIDEVNTFKVTESEAV